jgi:hypothetical protein
MVDGNFIQLSIIINIWIGICDKHYTDYIRFDFRISFKENGKIYSDELALDIDNITNNKNIFRETFNVNTGKISKQYQVGMIWMIFYRISFRFI